MKELKNVLIRKIKIEDSEILYALINESRGDIGKYLPWVDTTNSVSDEENFIKYALSQNQNGNLYPYVIIWNDQIAGMIDLHNIDHDNRKAYIGYWLGNSFTGNGIVHQSIKLLSELAFKKFNLHKLIIQSEDSNQRSINVAKRAGFKMEGKSIDEVYFHDCYHTFINYYLLNTNL